MKKKIILLIALIETAIMLAACTTTKSINVEESINSESNKVAKENTPEEKHSPNMVAIFDGDKIQRFPFVYYTITGDKIVFDKLKIVYENGMACPIPGATTGEFNLSDCVLYYSASGLSLVDGADSEVLLRGLVG